ncbi:hypothetical protein [Pallidibacillus pasinlerensis]|uniref:DUF3592 domain-containing protein n=1 Tax=Pallidibacillus pasinlerensis TaxID=2703818 RepID=A0ABX0A3Y5_9BACI|nr:hypothetical protein [Pallidibacillus pasinlerensis]NCU18151.1 hypothetical protein [Pallidibacillus pasinlerensis]
MDKKSILLLIFTIASFVFMVIFFKKGEGVADSLIQKELYSSLGGLFLGLFAVFLLAFISLLARKRVWKVLAIIALIIFSFATLQEMRYVLLLSDDKKLYEQGEFETFVGTPDEVKYDHKNEYLFELHFGDQSFNVHHLKISRSFYKEELEGKQLEIQYLPNSKLPVSLEHGDGFGVSFGTEAFGTEGRVPCSKAGTGGCSRV